MSVDRVDDDGKLREVVHQGVDSLGSDSRKLALEFWPLKDVP
jgi:hypothetical protein